jgi:large subunit ribosomal protein L6
MALEGALLHIAINMKKPILYDIEIPSGVSASIEARRLRLEGPQGRVERKIPMDIIIEQKEGKLIIKHPRATKKEKKIINSFKAHVMNMLEGVQRQFIYRLKICNVHFPMTVSSEGKNLIIKNFLGEVRERKAEIIDSVHVKIEKDIIEVQSPDKEKAGQTAANIERATWIRMRDRRVFQDGIFLVEKPGEEL